MNQRWGGDFVISRRFMPSGAVRTEFTKRATWLRESQISSGVWLLLAGYALLGNPPSSLVRRVLALGLVSTGSGVGLQIERDVKGAIFGRGSIA